MIHNHIMTTEMVKKLLNVIENRVEKTKDKKLFRNRNLETTL